MKTLVIILNHNLPDITDKLYESLLPYKKHDYDLMILDNGSKKEFRSKFTHLKLKENIFWGGALNYSFRYVQENKEYDSLLFLNNDIELNGEIFVQKMRDCLFSHELAVVSPCIAGKADPWKQMQNWGCVGVRLVKWIDNQAPLFHRKLIEEIGQFDPILKYGWGQELVCYEVCLQQKWIIGVIDSLCILHYGRQTFERNRLMLKDKEVDNTYFNMDYQNFSQKAKLAWESLYAQKPDEFITLINYGQFYSPKEIITI